MTTPQTDELNVLFPARSVAVAGESVTLHEYTLAEQLQHRATLKTLSDAFSAVLDGVPTDVPVPLDALLDVFAANYDAVIDAVALSCGQPSGWVAGLAGEDAENLLFTWWGVNAGFFTRAAVRPVLEKLARESLSAGAKSSAP